jgi:hypothetical protein
MLNTWLTKFYINYKSAIIEIEYKNISVLKQLNNVRKILNLKV